MFRYIIWLLIALSSAGTCTALDGDESFVKESNCTWSRPPKCSRKQNSSAFKIDLHFMASRSGLENSFPQELKQSARLAANTWMRAIRGRRPTRAVKMKKLPTGCGPTSSTRNGTSAASSYRTVKTENTVDGDLIVCLKMDDSVYKDETLAHTQVWDIGSDALPRVVIVGINAKHAGRFDRCDWNNILMHEIGHALGFGIGTFRNRGLYHQKGERWTPVFLGDNTKREWQAMGGGSKDDANNTYPPLLMTDSSHWPESCLNVHELMSSQFVGSSWLMRYWEDGNSRAALSRLTLAVFQDLGYEVDMKCADEKVVLYRCRRGSLGPSESARPLLKRRNNRKVAFKKLRRKFRRFKQTMLLKDTLFREICREVVVHLGRIRKKLHRRWIPKVKKKCRKSYRRLRRVMKLRVRETLPSLTLVVNTH